MSGCHLLSGAKPLFIVYCFFVFLFLFSVVARKNLLHTDEIKKEKCTTKKKKKISDDFCPKPKKKK